MMVEKDKQVRNISSLFIFIKFAKKSILKE